jgi:hypothetical protein
MPRSKDREAYARAGVARRRTSATKLAELDLMYTKSEAFTEFLGIMIRFAFYLAVRA